MTQIEKQKIYELREQGLGYKAIAKEMNVTPSSVRCILAKAKEEKLKRNCKCCGLEIKSVEGKKRKVFCSDRCRMMWWNSHKDLVNRKAFYDFVCPCCKKKFKAYGNSKRKFCSIACAVKSRTKKVDENE